MKHIDLFTGLGGFTLAAHANGIQTVVMCEKEEWLREGLKKAWPGIPIVPDIHEFDGTKWSGAFILTAGVPCQPISVAGKRRGAEDDRWLWPETLRVVEEAKPRWCLLENPPGIRSLGLDGILSDLEALGYEIGVLNIPACAVGSPQLRHRLWIVGNAPGGAGAVLLQPGESRQTDINPGGTSQSHLADAQRPARIGVQDGEKHETPSPHGRCSADPWGAYFWTPCADGKVRRTPNDSFGLVDGLPRRILAGLGNSIVWPVAAEIIEAMKGATNE